jgi:hypothetical protein
MIRKSIALASIAMCLALTTYGIAQSLGTSSGKQAPKVKESPEQKQERILAALKLSKKQRQDYDKLVEWKKEETKKMYAQGAGAMEYGMKLNQGWRAGLQKIFTPDQWNMFVDMSGYGFLATSGIAGTGSPADSFGSKEDQILASLNLSDKQKKEIKELYAQLAIENQKLKELWDGTDAHAIGVQGGKINRMQNEGMKRIMTPEQHASYLKQWGADKKYQPDGKVYSPSQPVPRGSKNPPPVAR